MAVSRKRTAKTFSEMMNKETLDAGKQKEDKI